MVSAAGVKLGSGAKVAEVREKEREKERETHETTVSYRYVYFGFYSEMRPIESLLFLLCDAYLEISGYFTNLSRPAPVLYACLGRHRNIQFKERPLEFPNFLISIHK